MSRPTRPEVARHQEQPEGEHGRQVRDLVGQSGEGDESTLAIKEIRVDEGITMKRFMPRARGAAYPIRKRTSRISIVLEKRLGKVKARNSKSETKHPNALNTKH